MALLIVQAVFYCISAAISAFFFVKWRQADADSKSRIWRRYGLFCSLICVGSCGGALASSTEIQERYYFVRINHAGQSAPCGFFDFQCYVNSFADSAQCEAQTAYWSSIGQVPLAIEFLCLCFAKLLVRCPFFATTFLDFVCSIIPPPPPLFLQLLERMVDFVMLGREPIPWLTIAARAVFGVTTVSNIVNLCCYAASAYYLRRAYTAGTAVVSDLRDPTFVPLQFSNCFQLQKCQTLDDYNAELEFDNKGLDSDSVASICEFISLIFIISAYVVAGVYCVRRFRTAAVGGVTSSGNARVVRQITVTVCTVFVTFLLRAGYAVIIGISRFNTKIQSVQDGCSNFCLPCQGLGDIVQAWDRLTPELRDFIFLLSSPLTMLVALWGTYSPLLRSVLFARTQISMEEKEQLRIKELSLR